MAKHLVQTDYFEGPLDLLLHLVSRQKLDIGAVSVTEIADQYLAHIEHMRELDLDVASEFLLLAATLLEVKATALLPQSESYTGSELDDLSPEEMRNVLVARLLVYKQFKNVAAALEVRSENEGRMHPRQAGLEPQFLKTLPDYLEGVTLRTLALICADLEQRRDRFMLEAEHIASVPISLEEYADGVRTMLGAHKQLSFTELLPPDASAEVIVVTFLAILELYKRGLCDLSQDEEGETIHLHRLSQRETAKRGLDPEGLEGFDNYK